MGLWRSRSSCCGRAKRISSYDGVARLLDRRMCANARMSDHDVVLSLCKKMGDRCLHVTQGSTDAERNRRRPRALFQRSQLCFLADALDVFARAASEDEESKYDMLEKMRACCKAVSNVGMFRENCVGLVAHGAVSRLKRAMRLYQDDWKVQWLACSALWNLARPLDIRSHLTQDRETAATSFPEKALVQETAIGALANLSIADDAKTVIGQNPQLPRIVFGAIWRHLTEPRVLTSACSLMTNLAFDDGISEQLVNQGAVSHVVRAMTAHPDEMQLQRNACAALSNMATTHGHAAELLACGAIEPLLRAYRRALVEGEDGTDNNNRVTTLASNALTMCGVGADMLQPLVRDVPVALDVSDESDSIHLRLYSPSATSASSMMRQLQLQSPRHRLTDTEGEGSTLNGGTARSEGQVPVGGDPREHPILWQSVLSFHAAAVFDGYTSPVYTGIGADRICNDSRVATLLYYLVVLQQDVDCVDAEGNTALHHMLMSLGEGGVQIESKLATLELLTLCGASCEARNKAGMTPVELLELIMPSQAVVFKQRLKDAMFMGRNAYRELQSAVTEQLDVATLRLPVDVCTHIAEFVYLPALLSQSALETVNARGQTVTLTVLTEDTNALLTRAASHTYVPVKRERTAKRRRKNESSVDIDIEKRDSDSDSADSDSDSDSDSSVRSERWLTETVSLTASAELTALSTCCCGTHRRTTRTDRPHQSSQSSDPSERTPESESVPSVLAQLPLRPPVISHLLSQRLRGLRGRFFVAPVRMRPITVAPRD
ncbi:MAG: hypothetical protein MHM6MM_007029 [Cercozoa sp. M6MM]